MAWSLRTLAVSVCFLALVGTADPRTKPPLKNACQLATNAEITSVMGRTLNRTATSDPTGCVWKSGRKAQAGFGVSGFATVRGAKDWLAFQERRYEMCDKPPDHFLPGSGLGDDALLDGCGSDISFRLGRVGVEVVTYTNDVDEGSAADTRRTAALTRKAVRHLRRLRCPRSFCWLR